MIYPNITLARDEERCGRPLNRPNLPGVRESSGGVSAMEHCSVVMPKEMYPIFIREYTFKIEKGIFVIPDIISKKRLNEEKKRREEKKMRALNHSVERKRNENVTINLRRPLEKDSSQSSPNMVIGSSKDNRIYMENYGKTHGQKLDGLLEREKSEEKSKLKISVPRGYFLQSYGPMDCLHPLNDVNQNRSEHLPSSSSSLLGNVEMEKQKRDEAMKIVKECLYCTGTHKRKEEALGKKKMRNASTQTELVVFISILFLFFPPCYSKNVQNCQEKVDESSDGLYSQHFLPLNHFPQSFFDFHLEFNRVFCSEYSRCFCSDFRVFNINFANLKSDSFLDNWIIIMRTRPQTSKKAPPGGKVPRKVLPPIESDEESVGGYPEDSDWTENGGKNVEEEEEEEEMDKEEEQKNVNAMKELFGNFGEEIRNEKKSNISEKKVLKFTKRCTECKQIGHTKRSKNCPANKCPTKSSGKQVEKDKEKNKNLTLGKEKKNENLNKVIVGEHSNIGKGNLKNPITDNSGDVSTQSSLPQASSSVSASLVNVGGNNSLDLVKIVGDLNAKVMELEKEKETRRLVQEMKKKEREYSIRIANRYLEERKKDDEKEKLTGNEKMGHHPKGFFDAQVSVHDPRKKPVDDVKLNKEWDSLKKRKESLLGTKRGNEEVIGGKGIHHKEAGKLIHIKRLVSEAMDFVPRDGCKNVSDRALYWGKLEAIKEAVQQCIHHAAQWDEDNLPAKRERLNEQELIGPQAPSAASNSQHGN